MVTLQQLTTLGRCCLLRGEVLLCLLRLDLLVLDILEGCIAGGLPDFRTLAALGLDDIERGALNGLRDGGCLAAGAAALRLLLRALLVQTAVQLRPAVLRGLAPHVERGLALRVDEDVAAAIGPDVPAAMAGVDPEAGVEAKISPKVAKRVREVAQIRGEGSKRDAKEDKKKSAIKIIEVRTRSNAQKVEPRRRKSKQHALFNARFADARATQIVDALANILNDHFDKSMGRRSRRQLRLQH